MVQQNIFGLLANNSVLITLDVYIRNAVKKHTSKKYDAMCVYVVYKL